MLWAAHLWLAPWLARASFAGVGHFVPERVVKNRDLESLMDTTDEWILQRTGIRERHIVDK